MGTCVPATCVPATYVNTVPMCRCCPLCFLARRVVAAAFKEKARGAFDKLMAAVESARPAATAAGGTSPSAATAAAATAAPLLGSGGSGGAGASPLPPSSAAAQPPHDAFTLLDEEDEEAGEGTSLLTKRSSAAAAPQQRQQQQQVLAPPLGAYVPPALVHDEEEQAATVAQQAPVLLQHQEQLPQQPAIVAAAGPDLIDFGDDDAPVQPPCEWRVMEPVKMTHVLLHATVQCLAFPMPRWHPAAERHVGLASWRWSTAFYRAVPISDALSPAPSPPWRSTTSLASLAVPCHTPFLPPPNSLTVLSCLSRLPLQSRRRFSLWSPTSPPPPSAPHPPPTWPPINTPTSTSPALLPTLHSAPRPALAPLPQPLVAARRRLTP